MLNAMNEKLALAQRLREFARGRCAFEVVEECAFDIRDRWQAASVLDLPKKSSDELALWSAVWEITSACRDSLVSTSSEPHPVLRHIAYLEGSKPVPDGWSAERP